MKSKRFIIILLFILLITLTVSHATNETQKIDDKESILINNDTISMDNSLKNYSNINTNNKIQKEDKTLRTDSTTTIENKTIKAWLKTYNNTIIKNSKLNNLTNFGNLELINCTFSNIKSDSILIYNKGNLSLINTTIENSQSLKYLVYGANITKIINCTFKNNTIKEESQSSTLFRFQNTIMENTIFQNNHGGIFGLNLKINNCTFNNTIKNNTNYAAHNGGAIITTGNTRITNSIFNNNTIKDNKNKMGVGGAIYNTGTLTLTNNTLQVNNASKAGAIYNKGVINSNNDVYENNTAKYYDIIVNMKTYNLLNGVLNESGYPGYPNNYSAYGKILNTKSMLLKNNKIYQLVNRVYDYQKRTYQSFFIINNTGNLTMIHNSIHNNYGSIYSKGNLIMTNNSIFDQQIYNHTFITVTNHNFTLTNNKILRNKLFIKNSSLILCNNSNEIIIENNNFTLNNCILIVNNNSKKIDCKNNTFIEPKHGYNENSLIRNYKTQMNIINNTFSGHKAYSGNLTNLITNCNATMTVENNVFDSIMLFSREDWIKTTYPSKVSYDKISFAYNSVILDQNGNITIKDNTFNNINESSPYQGDCGCCIILNNSRAVIENNTFTNITILRSYYSVYNQSTWEEYTYYFNSYGGALYIKNSNVNITNNKFINTKAEYGSAICNINSNISVTANTFQNNTAFVYGSSIYNKGNMNITNNHFINTKDKNNATIYTSTFSYHQNGILVQVPTTTNVINNTFSSDRKHAITNVNSTLNEENNIFALN